MLQSPMIALVFSQVGVLKGFCLFLSFFHEEVLEALEKLNVSLPP